MGETEKKPLDRFVDFIYEATRIFRGAHMAWDFKKLAFALGAVILWAVGAMLINVLMPYYYMILIAAGLVAIGFILAVFATGDVEIGVRKSVAAVAGAIIAVAVVVTVVAYVMKDFRAAEKAFFFQSLWGLAVASFFGTAIARIAAVWAATEDSVGIRDAARFALNKLATSIWTLLLPAAALLGFAIFLMCIGLPGRIPLAGKIWYVIVGVLYLVWLMGGLCFALVFVMYIPGLTLFQPAIAAEGEDAFGAFSNAYRFVLQRPWRLLFYGLLAFIYGRIILSLAALVVTYAATITNKPLEWGMGKETFGQAGKLNLGAQIFDGSFFSWSGPGVSAFNHILDGRVLESFKDAPVGGWFIILWQYVLLALFMAFAVSLFYSLATQVYFLMRKAADGTPFDEIYVEEPEEEQFAGEFAETPKPAEATKPVLDDIPGGVDRKTPSAQEKDKPIDLAGEDKQID